MAVVVVTRDLINTEVTLYASEEPQEVPDDIVAKFPQAFGELTEESADEVIDLVDPYSDEEE